MIKVILRNYDTNEILSVHLFNPKKGNNPLEEALKYYEKLQEIQDVLNLGAPCRLVHDGFALGVNNIYSKGCRQNTTGFDEPLLGCNNQTPKYIQIAANPVETTTLRISAESYLCGLVINTGKTYQGGIFGCGGIQSAYFRRFSSANVFSGEKNKAKVFLDPREVKNYLEKKKEVFRYLVESHNYNLSVEYATEEYEQDINAMDAKKKERWDQQMDELKEYLDELNNITAEPEYATPAAKALAEWEATESDEEPVALTEEDYKAEALLRMKSLGMWDQVVNGLESEGKIYMCEAPMGIYYDLDETAEKAVEYARHVGGYPYAAIRSYSKDLGTITDVLYVSKSPSEWPGDRPNKDGCTMSCCVSDATFGDAEFGEIQIVSIPSSGGIKRIG